MKAWKEAFQRYWMSADIKPKGRFRRVIEGKTRAMLKRELQRELSESCDTAPNSPEKPKV